ncbi:MAG: hydrogenase formation protein HypD [Candidatus Omnitrophota bacterium]|nr:MAG: hydrogenase formation protein HypD [Candidatus Omnitrophota bacterium]
MRQESKIKLMEVCGTHTMAIARAGIKKLLPANIELVSGPGCPVCVTSQGDIDRAIEISRIKDVIMATFGDMMRVPGTNGSLEGMKRQGYDIRVVYSSLDALNIAKDNPGKKVVLMGIGFETTSPTIAATIIEAKRKKAQNFFILSNFKLIFPALEALAGSEKIKIDGFICPGHVSVITGSIPYEKIAKRYKKPSVITGFGTIDIFRGVERLINQIKNHKYEVEIAYKRAVKKRGNSTARKILDSVFEVGDSEWRGLGIIKKSGLKLRKEYEDFDAERIFKVKIPKTRKIPGCLCGEVLQGIKSPRNCKLFKKICTPQNPVGPCMVSSEGTCAAYYRYG